MNREELIQKIKNLIPSALESYKKGEVSAIEYDELQKFPNLKKVIIDLLTVDYGKFIDGIDWVAPKPTTFRINLLNGQFFYLIYNKRSWTAEIEGKKYYLLDLPKQEIASQAIAKILRYGAEIEETPNGVDAEEAEEMPKEKPEKKESENKV
jgi:hypothetical protein